MQFTDATSLSGTRITADGYLVADVLCARTGCQTYLASELGMVGDTVTVFRPESAVFSKDSMATFAGKPVTLGHPPEMVTADNWKTYAIGDIGEDIARDGEFIRVPIKMMDAAAIRAVNDGTREISMGYTTPIAMQDGVAPDGTPYQAVQTGPIKINHLALVDRARGGSNLRIGDADHWGASPIPQADMKGSQMADTLRKIVVDGLQVETTDAGATAIEKLTKTIATKDAEIADASVAHKAALDAKDGVLAAKDAEIAKLKAEKLSDADLDARVASRVDLVGKAKAVAKDLDTKGMSDADIRKAAVVAALGDAAVADKSEAYIEARFDMLAEDAAIGDPVAKLVTTKPATGLHAVYTARDADLANAWKQEKKGA